jgi:hypothetical protein
MRLHSRCVSTIQALMDLKNPRPVAYVQQANIGTGNTVNGWTDQRRATQSTLIRNWQPWARSTGPKTATGKRGVRTSVASGLPCRCSLALCPAPGTRLFPWGGV